MGPGEHGGLAQAADILAVEGDGLLDQHVLAGLEGAGGVVDVAVGVGADADEVDIAGQKRIKVGVAADSGGVKEAFGGTGREVSGGGRFTGEA